VAESDVGGAAHNGRMDNEQMCERCDGAGVDPRQGFEDEVTMCVECRGDGVVLCFEIVERELALTA